EVVVGAELQALDAVRDGVPRRQEQDRRLLAGAAEVREDRPAVAPGEHDVENDEVVGARQRRVQTVLTLAGHVHGETVLGEPLAEVGGGLRLVLDDENFHARLPRPSRGAAGAILPPGMRSATGYFLAKRAGIYLPSEQEHCTISESEVPQCRP